MRRFVVTELSSAFLASELPAYDCMDPTADSVISCHFHPLWCGASYEIVHDSVYGMFLVDPHVSV